MIKQLFQYTKRLIQLGPKVSASRLVSKISKARTQSFWRKKITSGYKGHSFEEIKKLTNLKQTLKLKQSFFSRNKDLIPDLFFDSKKMEELCSKFLCCEIFLFNKTIKIDEINWHQDPFATSKKTAWNQSENLQLCYDINLLANKVRNISERNPDPRVVWEISRLQHLLPLGLCFQKTKNPKFKRNFENHVESWLNSNPFMMGINWVCTMEVAIRASVLVWLFELFECEKDLNIDDEDCRNFSQKLAASLYDHFVFIKDHPETSATPNNHYLADLVGQLYLANFFGLKKATACNEIEEAEKILASEFENQILPDGTSYEGSVHYHKLVVEFFLHYTFLKEPSRQEKTTLKAMTNFLERCQTENKLLQVGDNDNGRFIFGLKIKPISKTQIQQSHLYPHFGLSIIQNKNWHITLRHPTFKKTQPTGHFHKDELALTVNHNGLPLIIDPGTGIYSGNIELRNQLRGIESHSTFFSKLFSKQIQKDPENLFELDRTETGAAKNEERVLATLGKVKSNNFEQQRQINFLEDGLKICIEDSWSFKSKPKEPILNWNWIFAENISLEKRSNFSWTLTTKNNESFILSSTIPLTLDPWLCADGYTGIKTCYKLKGTISTNKLSGKVVTILHSA
jgi:hypothetical protein